MAAETATKAALVHGLKSVDVMVKGCLLYTSYRAAKQGKTLVLNLGYSHQVDLVDPEGIETVLDGQNKICLLYTSRCV